ncbi:MAG: AAA family ATPase [Deltaproteobacteria bacterium]|nr:AAA family ATPase [Deltaproteobacteria bacterium]
MLKHLEVHNFKAWHSLDLKLGKVTGLFGTNSSGKSSVLQFLLLLKQTKDATDRGLVLDFGGPNQLVNLGTYESIVHRGDHTAEIAWTMHWDLVKTLRVADPMSPRNPALFEGKSLQESSRVAFVDSHLSTRYVKYGFSDAVFSIEPKGASSDKFDLASEGDTAPQLIRNPGRPWPLPHPLKTHLFPDQAYIYFQNTGFLRDFVAEYEALMDRVVYLGPLREHPQREYRWSGASPHDVGPRGERTVDAILAATARNDEQNLAPRRRYMKFQEMIAYWLRELGLIHSFEIKEIGSGTNLYQACVRTAPDSPETMLTDVGFGVSQILPVLVLLCRVGGGAPQGWPPSAAQTARTVFP